MYSAQTTTHSTRKGWIYINIFIATSAGRIDIRRLLDKFFGEKTIKNQSSEWKHFHMQSLKNILSKRMAHRKMIHASKIMRVAYDMRDSYSDTQYSFWKHFYLLQNGGGTEIFISTNPREALRPSDTNGIQIILYCSNTYKVLWRNGAVRNIRFCM